MVAGSRTRSRTRPSYVTAPFQRRRKYICSDPWTEWLTHAGSTHKCFYETMSDVVHTFPYADGPLYHHRWEGRPFTVAGLCRQLSSNGKCVDVEVNHTNTAITGVDYQSSAYTHVDTGLTADASSYINEALAKKNPGAPAVDLAAFIAELRQLPSTIKSLGKLSQAPIATSFGVIPTLGDIQAILSLTDSIAARQKQLRKLSKGTQKERLSLAFRKADAEWSLSMHNYSGFYPTIKRSTTRRVWAVKSHHIETNPLKPPPKYDTSYVRRLLTSASTVATVWELLPWSWLVDYFVGIQSMINAAGGNRIPGYVVSSLCVCVETKTHIDIVSRGRSSRWSGGSARPGYVDILTQQRSIFSDPRPGFPRVTGYLTPRQLSNIAQLVLAMQGRR